MERESTKLGKLRIDYINRVEYHTVKNEIFNQEIYHTQFDREDPVIIDVGAHIGLATLYFKSAYPDAKIIALEPNPHLYPILADNLFYNGFDDVVCVNAALDANSGRGKLYIDSTGNHWYSNSSLSPGGWTGVEMDSPVVCDLITLQTLFQKYQLERVDLLKLDVEGVEKRILKGAGASLKKVDKIIVELHSERNRYINEVKEILLKAGFQSEIGNSYRKGLVMLTANRETK